MLIRSIKALLTFVIISFCCCSTVNRNDVQHIVYGTYAGECIHHCSFMFKLDDNRLLVDTTDSFFGNSQKMERVIFKGDTLGGADFLKAQVIKRSIPFLLINSQSKDFGNPDAHDQGGIYVQLRISNELKTFYIDMETDKIPRELRGFVKLIENEVASKWDLFYR